MWLDLVVYINECNAIGQDLRIKTLDKIFGSGCQSIYVAHLVPCDLFEKAYITRDADLTSLMDVEARRSVAVLDDFDHETELSTPWV